MKINYLLIIPGFIESGGSWGYLTAVIIACALFIYLIYSLIKPEKF
jgi:K+-transporting ATPase KdpF subunit